MQKRSKALVRGGSRVGPGRLSAFTLVELLVVVALLAFGAGVLVPGFARTNSSSKAFQCLNNLRQLAAGWNVYAEDHSGAVIYNLDIPGVQNEINGGTYRNWANNVLDWSSAAINTNQALLRHGLFASYLGGDPTVYRCPADNYLSPLQRTSSWSARTRSYSMNAFFGPFGTNPNSGNWITGKNPFVPFYRQWLNTAQVPGPAKFWVFVEEHPDSINDGYFINTPETPGYWGDLPATFHNGASSLAFADSHAELHRWLSAKTSIPIKFTYSTPFLDPAGRSDYQWLLSRAGVAF